MTEKECLICDRIRLIRAGENPYFVAETETGFVVIGDNQLFHGYTLLLSKVHAKELHEVDPEFRRKFLWEMSEVAAAVHRAFKPEKLNYELLGNTDEHMHWHLFPRHADDPSPRTTIWAVPREIRGDPKQVPDSAQLSEMKNLLLSELVKEKIPITPGS